MAYKYLLQISDYFAILLLMPDNSLATINQDIPISLDKNEIAKLQGWEDWITYYLQLGEASNSFSWYKADLLLALFGKFGEGSLDKFASDVKEPKSTVINYVRTARAFPPEKRIAHLSFTHHFQASYADSFNEKTKEFEGEERYELLAKAADSGLSTRALQDEVKESKKTDYKEIKTCEFSGVSSEKVGRFIFYSPELHLAEKFYLHPDAFKEIVNYIRGHKK